MWFREFYKEWIHPALRVAATWLRQLGSWILAPFRWLENYFYQNRPEIILGGLVVLFLFVYFFWRIVVIIDAGQAGVKYRLFAGGTRVDRVYGEGIHLIFPWDSMSIYDVRVQELEYDVELLSRNGLRIKFLLSIRYRPEYNTLPLLHQEVGIEYVRKVVVPEVVSVLRTEVGTYTAEEVYTTKRGILDQVFNRAIDNVAQRYILVDQVIIKMIELPLIIQVAIEEKLEQREIAESYEFRLLAEQKEARRKEIEAEGFRTYNQTIAASLSADILRWKGIQATRELAASENSKIIVVGNGDGGLPIILGAGK